MVEKSAHLRVIHSPSSVCSADTLKKKKTQNKRVSVATPTRFKENQGPQKAACPQWLVGHGSAVRPQECQGAGMKEAGSLGPQTQAGSRHFLFRPLSLSTSEPTQVPLPSHQKRRPNMASTEYQLCGFRLLHIPKTLTLCHLPRHANKMLSEKVCV